MEDCRVEEVKERTRSERFNKKIRVNSSLDKVVHEKLDRLAMGCGITKTALAAYLVELCLDNENIINFVQDQYRESSRFALFQLKLKGGKVYF